MKKIPLARGMFAMVDDEDWDRVRRHSWYAKRDRRRGGECVSVAAYVEGREVALHRFIVGATRGMLVDHRHGNTLDNRRSQIRVASISQSNANRRRNRVSKTGLKGVSLRRSGSMAGRFRATVGRTDVGFFDSAEEAARAYDRAAVKRWGEFACLNFPEEFPHLKLRCARRAA